MKHWLSLVIVLMLAGCTVYDSSDLGTVVDEKLQEAQSVETSSSNHQKKYYSYYIEPQIGRFSANASGNVFSYEGTKFVMNLNVSSLINEKYYPDAQTVVDVSGRQVVVERTDTYRDITNTTHTYNLKIYELDHSYLTVFNSDVVLFYSVSDSLRAAELSGQMLLIARNLEVNVDDVIAAYSNKEIIQYTNEKIELFEEIAPENGRIEELFEDYKSITDDEIEEQEDQGMEQIGDTSDISGW